MGARRAWAVVGVAVAVVAAGCSSGDDGEAARSPDGATPPVSSAAMGVPVVDTIDVPGARAAMEAGQAEIRRILERDLGAERWTEARPAQENSSSSCGDVPEVGKFYAREMSHPEALDDATWEQAWSEIVRAVEPHGFRPKADEADPAADGSGPERFEYLVNAHRDELTVSSMPGIGTGYGGYSVCHPWTS